MSKKPYRKVSEEDKVKALKRHLVEKEPVSKVCDELGVSPSLFYKWQQQLFEQAPVWLGRRVKEQTSDADDKRVTILRERLRQREEALAELMAEYVALKKRSNGEA